jgi:hypothetical protein
MKHWILSICFLISVNTVNGCGGWYPFSDVIRFSIFSPLLFDDGGMSEFYFSSRNSSELYEHTFKSDRNVDDWFNVCEQKVKKNLVFEAIYQLSALGIVDEESDHIFVKKMMELGKEDHLQYLAFAKKNSYLNNAYEDSWERGYKELKHKRSHAIQDAEHYAELTEDKTLKRRYAFVAIRLAFYNGDHLQINRLYDNYFAGTTEVTIDYWAKYYQLHTVDSPVIRNFTLAQLFEKTPTKRPGLYLMFNRDVEMNDVLKFATTNKEKANVLFMYTLRKTDRQLSNIRRIYELNPDHVLLPFLIVREVNKLEHWVMSTKYTAFAPILRPGYDHRSSNQALINSAIEEDQKYAESFLSWLYSVKPTLNQELYNSVVSLTQFISDDAAAAYQTLSTAKYDDEELIAWKGRMMGILKVAAFKSTKIESIDLSIYLTGDYFARQRFLFLMGRLFEFRNDLGVAASLYSHLNQNKSRVVWAEPKGYTAFNLSFYSDYFDYFDANYNAQDVVGIVDYAKSAPKLNPELTHLLEHVTKDHVRLLDLIGTKYLRQGELLKSISYLKQVPTHYWQSDARSYKKYLSANPFYADFYSGHDERKADTITYTKYEVVQNLYDLIELEKTQTGNANAQTNFLIANCYFNMTTHGNSWMMKRSWWSKHSYNTVYVDSDEFNKCITAKSYYMKASNASEVDMFEALCLRMAGRCESYGLYFDEDYDYDFDYDPYGGFREYMFDKNTTYKALKNKFPEWHMELVSNCHSFNRFYSSM